MYPAVSGPSERTWGDSQQKPGLHPPGVGRGGLLQPWTPAFSTQHFIIKLVLELQIYSKVKRILQGIRVYPPPRLYPEHATVLALSSPVNLSLSAPHACRTDFKTNCRPQFTSSYVLQHACHPPEFNIYLKCIFFSRKIHIQ